MKKNTLDSDLKVPLLEERGWLNYMAVPTECLSGENKVTVVPSRLELIVVVQR
jgi:hypothetical protein